MEAETVEMLVGSHLAAVEKEGMLVHLHLAEEVMAVNLDEVGEIRSQLEQEHHNQLELEPVPVGCSC